MCNYYYYYYYYSNSIIDIDIDIDIDIIIMAMAMASASVSENPNLCKQPIIKTSKDLLQFLINLYNAFINNVYTKIILNSNIDCNVLIDILQHIELLLVNVCDALMVLYKLKQPDIINYCNQIKDNSIIIINTISMIFRGNLQEQAYTSNITLYSISIRINIASIKVIFDALNNSVNNAI